ncbi:MAG: hypothetical protein GY822_30400 [Deltaproteobacteria bacterium]|nr:hypothetical protein [Deltaproteobacteria bacterium]
MTPEELKELVAKSETQAIEGKSSHALKKSSWLTLKTICACMAFGNEENGGKIFVGCPENASGELFIEGFIAESKELLSWSRDGFGQLLQNYASPIPSFEIEHVLVGDEVVVVISVEGLTTFTPVLCKRKGMGIREGQDEKVQVLRESALYIRSGGKVESREPNSSEEVRKVLDLAIRNEVKSRLAQMQKALNKQGLSEEFGGKISNLIEGLFEKNSPQTGKNPVQTSNHQKALNDINNNPSNCLSSIRAPGNCYWTVQIVPTDSLKDTIRPANLWDELDLFAIRDLHDYPHFPVYFEGDERVSPSSHELCSSEENLNEEWHFTTSGAFFAWHGMGKMNGGISAWSIAMPVFGVFQMLKKIFSSRLAGRGLSVHFSFIGVKGLELVAGPELTFLRPGKICSADIHFDKEFSGKVSAQEIEAMVIPQMEDIYACFGYSRPNFIGTLYGLFKNQTK